MLFRAGLLGLWSRPWRIEERPFFQFGKVDLVMNSAGFRIGVCERVYSMFAFVMGTVKY